MAFTVEPEGHWKPGDRAFCIRGRKIDGRHLVEKGRVYRVAAVRTIDNVLADGLQLEGVDTGEKWGFWSGPFVCLRGSRPALAQIAERTRPSWLEAYQASSAVRAAL